MQFEDQNRLKQLTEQTKPGSDKIKSQTGDLLKFLSTTVSNGPMSMFFEVKIKMC